MISAKSLWPQQPIVLEQCDFALYGPLTNRIPCLVQTGLFGCTIKILDWWNLEQNRQGHFRYVNEGTALLQNNWWIGQTTTKYHTRLRCIKLRVIPWEIQTWRSRTALCYSSSRNCFNEDIQLKGIQKSSAGTEASPSAFVENVLVRSRTQVLKPLHHKEGPPLVHLVFRKYGVITQRIHHCTAS